MYNVLMSKVNILKNLIKGAKKGLDYKLCTCMLLVDYGSDIFVLRVACCLPIDIKETIPNWDKSHFIKLG